jgi:hypothetical protein
MTQGSFRTPVEVPEENQERPPGRGGGAHYIGCVVNGPEQYGATVVVADVQAIKTVLVDAHPENAALAMPALVRRRRFHGYGIGRALSRVA